MSADVAKLASDLAARVERINVLQHLLQAKDVLFADTTLTPVEATIKDEVRSFLFSLLQAELGLGSKQASAGLDLTPEKASALNQLLESLVARASGAAPTRALDQAPQPVLSPRQRRTSPVLEALKGQVGGDSAWNAMSKEDQAQKMKEFQAWRDAAE